MSSGWRTQHQALDLCPTRSRGLQSDVRERYDSVGEHQTDELSHLRRPFQACKLVIAQGPASNAVKSTLVGKRKLRCFQLLPRAGQLDTRPTAAFSVVV